MNPDNPETWHMNPVALHYVSSPAAILAVLMAIVVVWAIVSWRTDWRYRRWRRK